MDALHARPRIERHSKDRRWARIVWRTLDYAVMCLLTLFFIFPIVFMFVSAFKTERQMFLDLRTVIGAFLPTDVTLANFPTLFERVPFERFMLASLIVTFLTVTAGLFINSLTAFALARLRWRGKGAVLMLVVALIIVPLEAISVPMLVMVNELPWIALGSDGVQVVRGWLDSFHVQIIPFMANAFYIFLFYQFFIDIPKDFDEAAVVDGATPFGIYWRVIVPLSRPVFATVTILHSLTMWSSYLWPLMTTRSEVFRPLPVGIAGLFVNDQLVGDKWGPIMAFAALATIPVLIVFLVFQRGFIRSVASSGVKG
jgi:multiple sugar transport system permease protein